MLKDKQLIEIPWTQRAQKHFGGLGYSFVKGETILVSPEELPEGSQREVIAICDYCGKELNMQLQYRQYLKRIKKHDGKYYCKKCFGESKEAQQIKVSRSKKTCLEKYGVESPMQTEYDGQYWHQNQQKDIKRDRIVQKKGYKVLRIKGNTKVPDAGVLFDLIEELISSDKNYLEYQLDEYIKQKEDN